MTEPIIFCFLQMFIREIDLELDDGEEKTVKLDQKYEGDTGVVVWDAAIVLAKYLETIRNQIKDKNILELGSGTGAVGLSAAAIGAKVVVLSDQDELVEFLNHNIELNTEIIPKDSDVVALPLKWGDINHMEPVASKCGNIHFILMSDCVFYKESVDDLFNTLQALSDQNTIIFMSYEERDSQEKLEVMKMFFEKMKEKFIWEKIPHEKHHPDFECPDIQIFKFSLHKVVTAPKKNSKRGELMVVTEELNEELIG